MKKVKQAFFNQAGEFLKQTNCFFCKKIEVCRSYQDVVDFQSDKVWLCEKCSKEKIGTLERIF